MSTDRDNKDEALGQLLKKLPAPSPEPGFYDRALARAALEGVRRQRRRWLLTGFGSAIAAGLAIVALSGLFFDGLGLPDAEPNIPGVTMTLAEPHTVRLVFSAPEALPNARLTVSLPPGIEVDGFPGQREITWETSLAEGRNLLPLTLIATTPASGEVLARLEHENRNRTFRLRVSVS